MSRLPSGWYETTVGESADFLTGFPFASSRFVSSGIKLIRGSNVKRGEIDWSPDIAKYWAQPESVFRAFELARGDILIAMDGALVGRSYARVSDEELPAYLVQRVARLRGTSVNQGLLYAWVGSDEFASYVDSVKTHTAIPHISPRDIRNFSIAVPVSSEEQRQIADAISDADQLITSLEGLITKKWAIKQGVMQGLLTGRTRLPGHHEEWVERPLASVLGKLQAGVSVNSVLDSGQSAVLKTSCVSAGEFDPSESKTIAPSDIARAKVNPQADSLIVSRMNTPALVGEVGYVHVDWPKLFLPDRLWLATKKKSTSPVSMRWLGYLLSSPHYSRRLKELATGTSGSMKNLAKSSFLGITMPFPPIDEQVAIAEVLSDLDLDLANHRRRLAKARSLKLGVTQQLLTGRTRLSIKEAVS